MSVDPFLAAIARRVTPGVQLAASISGAESSRCVGRVAYGIDDAPITPRTRFDIASVGKVVTGLLALTLADEGVLDLDRDLSALLPECTLRGIGVRHLLTHTSGWDPTGLPPNRPRRHEREAYLRQLLTHAVVKAPPGEQQAYCTHAFTLVMLAIERATGRPFAAFARERLFAPLGMSLTAYDEAELGHPGFVTPLRAADDAPETWVHEVPVIGDGYLRTTASDLLRIGTLLLGRGAFAGRQVISERCAAAALHDATGGRFGHSGVFFLHGGSWQGVFAPAHRPGSGIHPGFFGCCLAVDPELDAAWAALSPSERLHDPVAWPWVGQAILTGQAGLEPVA